MGYGCFYLEQDAPHHSRSGRVKLPHYFGILRTTKPNLPPNLDAAASDRATKILNWTWASQLEYPSKTIPVHHRSSFSSAKKLFQQLTPLAWLVFVVFVKTLFWADLL